MGTESNCPILIRWYGKVGSALKIGESMKKIFWLFVLACSAVVFFVVILGTNPFIIGWVVQFILVYPGVILTAPLNLAFSSFSKYPSCSHWFGGHGPTCEVFGSLLIWLVLGVVSARKLLRRKV